METKPGLQRAREKRNMDKPRLERPVVETIDHVTPSLLGAMLGNLAVTDFEAERIGTGQVGEVYRLRVRYSDEKENNPATVILKIASRDPRSRASGLSLGIYNVETRFYDELAPAVAATTTCVPDCCYSAYDKDSGSFALLLEDVGADALVGNDLHGATLAQAQLAMAELGRLHGALLPLVQQAENQWLVQEKRLNAAMFEELFHAFKGRYRGRVTPEHLLICEHWVQSFAWYMDATRQPNVMALLGVIHGDYRMDNMLFPAGGDQAKVVDWQLLSVGPLASDLAYFLGGCLDPADRRGWLRDLLQTYLDALTAATGGQPLVTPEQLEHDLRMNAFYGVTIAITSSILVRQTDRGDDMFITLLSRHCELVRDLDALVILPGAPVTGVKDWTPLRPEPQDELPHPAQENKYWSESWYFDFVDESQGIAGWVRLGLTPNLKGNWYTALVSRPGKPLLLLEDYAAPASSGSGHTLHIQVEHYEVTHDVAPGEELKTYRIRFSGKAAAYDTPDGVLRGDPASSADEDLALDLTYHSAGTPYQYRISPRYEIPCAVSGVVTINSQQTNLHEVPGQRDHSWAPRDFWSLDWVWSSFHFGSQHYHVTELRFFGGARMPIGYVQQTGGEVRELEGVVCRETHNNVAGDEGRLVSKMDMTVTPRGGEAVKVSVEPVGHAPLRLVSDDGRVSLFDRAWGRVRLEDGRTGVGWFEWNQNVLGGEQV
ncbi:putative aminoglycoside phosphotransferase [Mycena metata]|uniref:Aminoglycoside phosphotransferase n=1 Tax=Mycena metata TaxID=1033252 RepID=A0AAD7IUQ7_9AGAR|nr:putative aminoglycoside phosphotransferase [Mycena metata]